MRIDILAKTLSDLYGSYGYSHYTMSKFEEYELYLRNKDFLVSDRVLTFTDTDGKLMALKPDVTLSIIKNTDDSDGSNHKVFYRENVYRPGKSEQGFREIMQVGLECIGKVDSYCILEVLLLAVKSLQAISERCVLDISHMGLLCVLLDKCGLHGADREAALKAIGSKNAHELRRICETAGAPWQALTDLTSLYGNLKTVLPKLEKIFEQTPEFVQFKMLLDTLYDLGINCINVDFSVVNDMNYYNGIVFRGFVEGVPAGVLSGGQYDSLMKKMQRKGQAIGFALYPDLLERLEQPMQPEGADAVLLYDGDADLCRLAKAVESFSRQGITVCAQQADQPVTLAAKVYRLVGNEVKCIG